LYPSAGYIEQTKDPFLKMMTESCVCTCVYANGVCLHVRVCVCTCVCVWQSKEARWHKSVRHDRRSIARGWWRRTCDIRCCCSCKGCRSRPRSVCMYIGGWVGHTQTSLIRSLPHLLPRSCACWLPRSRVCKCTRALSRERESAGSVCCSGSALLESFQLLCMCMWGGVA